jgi:signal transduction histidine kinase
VVKDSQGNVWFSTNHGLSVVNPDRSTDNSLPALLHVESITVDGSEVNLAQPMRVPSGRRKIVFHYLGLSLANPERVRYRYWLEGLDAGWSEANSNREAAFANLSPGKYRFRVICSNGDGLWNKEATIVDFSILPAFYQTNWFRTLCAAALFALLWGIYQLRVKQLNRQFNIALDARVNERTRIARELHDTVLQTLHGLLMSFQRAANLLPERPVEAKQRLEGAIDQAAQAITEGREAVQGLRSSTVVTNDLASAIQTLGEELAAKQVTENPPLFNVAVEGTLRDLNPLLRDDAFRIAGEALRNAFRHAQARRVEVDLHYDERQLRLRVRDDGKGVSAQLLSNKGRSGHWGLQGMRERAKLVGGHLEIWSELDSGTEIELRIPASIAYLNSSSGNRERARH